MNRPDSLFTIYLFWTLKGLPKSDLNIIILIDWVDKDSVCDFSLTQRNNALASIFFFKFSFWHF